MSNLLNIQDLRVHFDTLDGPVEALHSVSLSVKEGEIMGVVGESGCGKSVTSLVTIGLASCDVDEGSITFEGKELLHEVPEVTSKILSVFRACTSIAGVGLIISMLLLFNNPELGEFAIVASFLVIAVCMLFVFFIDTPNRHHENFLRSIRGNKISMIFQEPMTALNPLYTVEKQVSEVLRQHGKLDTAESSLGSRVGQALAYPATLLTNFVRSDMRAGLQLLGAFMFIFLVHQSGNSDTILDLLIYPVALLGDIAVWLLDVLDIIPDKLGLSKNLSAAMSLVEVAVIVSLYFYIEDLWHYPGALDELIKTLNNGIRRTPQILVWYVVIFILLWVPFGVLMAIIGSVAILAIPPIQISGFLRLDPAHRKQVVSILEDVRIPNPEAVVKMYPHELSGGMRQRVMIAMMMACEPKLLIADEPTTALDVTIQAQILGLMKDLRDREGTAIMMITHDLGVIAETCDAVSVMYAGSVVETGSLEQVLGSPRMPYTIGLLHSIPRIKEEGEVRTDLPIIPGQVPDPNTVFDGCRFHPRCPFADDLCRSTPPPMEQVSEGHFASCHHTELTVDLEAAQRAFSASQFLQSEVSVQ
uniref:Oligopeptide ABC transporter ATP-binding protein (ABC.PE.A) n=1 Tax=uncultured marine group II/III euryarchaeote AD1000_24_C10 TaxID=1457741 RepID=A0A075FMN6_9EURY|nr:oligopeptide ABC transporter ATP-binding protein (ABC.PE.A) [uncultured marine group II/III euryarchaeote AD1000_24_C10]